MASKPLPSPHPEDVDPHYRRLIHQAHGDGARIRLVKQIESFDAPVFVTDLDNGPRHVRLLGTFARTNEASNDTDPNVVTLSAMDLIWPTRLGLDYARLMSIAFALCKKPESALMLGLGGADIWRFARAAVPECAVTLVEIDADIAGIAQRWFYLSQPAVIMPAERFLADTDRQFDVLLLDFYDGRSDFVLEPDFWTHCLKALAPGACIAANWIRADNRTKAMAEALTEAARARGHDCFFVAPRDGRGNIIQFLATADGHGLDTVAASFELFAKERHISEADRPDLGNHIISTAFPIVE